MSDSDLIIPADFNKISYRFLLLLSPRNYCRSLFPGETTFKPRFYSFRLTAQSGLEFLADRPVDQEVGGAVDRQQEVVQPDGHLDPGD